MRFAHLKTHHRFERLRLRDALDEIDNLPDDADIVGYEKVFGGLDEIEAGWVPGTVPFPVPPVATFT